MSTARFCIKHRVTTLLAVIMIAIFGVVFTILFGALGILIKHKFRKFREKRANKKAGIPDNEGTAAENKEEITKTIQAEERTDSNGEQ